MSNYRRSIGCIIALIFLLISIGTSAYAAAWPDISPVDAKNIMPLSEVKRGMRGYGLTVFQGDKFEQFDVLVLGVLKKMNTGRDLIMVRVGGGPITARNTGILSGMSGSPIYIAGKLVGAISYGATFSREPVGMVTPIADMLEAWDPNLPKHASGYSSAQSLPEPITVDGKTVNKVEIDPFGSQPKGIDNGTIYMQPLGTPLMVSGMSQRGIDKLAGILRPYNIRPMAGPGSGAASDIEVNSNLKAGSAIGMSIAAGDIDLTGIGTVTYNRDGRILAFGHPMLGVGAIDAPMTTAYITDLMSSYYSSFKMGYAVATVGRIFQDRPWCIAGAIGPKPKMIPVTISVNDESFKRDRVYRIGVINHPILASLLVSMVTEEAIYEMHSTPGDATAEVSYDVVADQVGKISRSNVFFDPVAVDMSAASDILSLLRILSVNKFHPLDVHSVNVKVRIMSKRNTATIDRIFVKKSEFEPGETVDVGVVLRPYKSQRITRTCQVKIPFTAPDGKIILNVRGGATPAGLLMASSAASMGPNSSDDDDDVPILMALPGSSGMANADDVHQLVARFLEREKNNDIVVQLMMRGTAMNIAGEKLDGLPSAIADVMRSSRNSGLRMEREEVKEIYADDSIISGTARLMIDVKKKSFKEGKPAPKRDLPTLSTVSSSGSMPSPDSIDSLDLSDLSDYFVSTATDDSADDDEDDTTSSDDAKPEEEKPVAKSEESKDSADSKASEKKSPADKPALDKPTLTSKSNVKTVVRQMQTWTHKSQTDFANGIFAGVSASSENKLEMAPRLKRLVETPDEFVWCVAATKGGVYAGTGNSGKIYKVSESGESNVFFETGELEVHSIVCDSAGNVYAGTSPRGKVYKISPDGTGSLFFETAEKYVLALALDDDGNLYAGVGDAGIVYKILPGGFGAPFVTVNEQHILSLHWDKKGSLLIGTGINGVVYRATKSGSVRPIFDAEEPSITAVVADNEGNVYVGTSPKGVIYKINPGGRSKPVYSKATRVMSMVCDSKNNIYAVSDNTILKITPDDAVAGLDSSSDKVSYLSIALNEETNDLYAGTGNVGSVYAGKRNDAKGTYESPVHDAKMISKWGRIKWVADTPEGSAVELRIRTGNVDTPDSTWTDWSEPFKDSNGEAIKSAPGRYIQYQVSLSTSKPDVSPNVSVVSITYLTPNQPPTVKLTAPAGDEVWAGNQTIKWSGVDPDKDKLSYDISYSNDAGKTWTTLAGALADDKAETKTAGEIEAKIKSELEKSKDIPEDMKSQFIMDPKSELKITSDPLSRPAAVSSTSTSHSWNTSTVKDGTYIIKIVASDKISNADDPLTDTFISDPIIVCNKAPKIKLTRKSLTAKEQSPVTVAGVASSELVAIVGVQYRVDTGEWSAASPGNGMFDELTEDFSFTIPKLIRGKHSIEVQAIDAAGNAATEIVSVDVG